MQDLMEIIFAGAKKDKRTFSNGGISWDKLLRTCL